ncbi:MAG: hypothetical protein QXL94_06505 [Candidatus Parvarchaeum sp.]
MTDEMKAFIKKHSARDLYISSKVDETYLEPIFKAWKEHGIRKREIILLGMVVGYKLEKAGKLKHIVDCANIGENKGKLKDMGELGGFDNKDISLILTLCIAKYGVDQTISRLYEILDELRVLSEKGIMFLYCNLFKEFIIKGKQLEYIQDIDKLISI